jgi:Putative exonuclease SbcCD, C subunit
MNDSAALTNTRPVANAHLADLAPRYRLMSVPGAPLELQVADQDLGSEVRTINSLSGGEIFLVSLALALGLSGISTRATQAQTLFIDEGFGTLDRDTLDHAMVALENLQATGRTVASSRTCPSSKNDSAHRRGWNGRYAGRAGWWSWGRRVLGTQPAQDGVAIPLRGAEREDAGIPKTSSEPMRHEEWSPTRP